MGRLKLLLILVLTSTCFYSIGGFSVWASILLGTCFSIIADWVLVLKMIAIFQPYRMTIFVNYDALCNDLGFARMPRSEEGTFEHDSDQPEREVFIFTALTATVFAHYESYNGKSAIELGLTDEQARSSECYRTCIRFEREIPGVSTFAQLYRHKQSLFFGEAKDGFYFGINVGQEWWKTYCKQLNGEICNLPVSYGGEVVLASIPNGYYPTHLRKLDKAIFLSGFYNWKQHRWIKKLAALGWTIDEDFPHQLKHRYLSVTFSDI